MTAKIHNLSPRILLAAPFLIMLFLVGLTRTAAFAGNATQLSTAILLDFLITIPVLHYFLIRKREDIPNITAISMMILGLIVAGFVLPIEQQGLLNSIKTIAIPLAEVGLLGYVIIKARKIVLEYRKGDRTGDSFDAIREACKQALPGKLGGLFATEIGVFYYLFFARKQERKAGEYSYFEKSGIKLVVIVFLFLAIAEVGIAHLLLERWSVTVAWVTTFFGTYACLQIMALLRSMDKRLIFLDTDNRSLHLRYGFFAQSSIPLDDIVEVEDTKKSLPQDNSIIQFSPLGLLDNHNLIIRLKNPNQIEKAYGIIKEYENIAIYVDEKDEFIAALNAQAKN